MENISSELQKKPQYYQSALLTSKDLNNALTGDLIDYCSADLQKILLSPLQYFTENKSNLFRARLVELSVSLCSDKTLVFTKKYQKEISHRLSKLIETLHAGSLIIDDIQDDAKSRRDRPSLHVEIGVPLAINSGSWLYFLALSSISEMDLEPRAEVAVNRICHQAMIKGHLGQALDLGVCIDDVEQQKARELSVSALNLKTGALMSLACELGAVVCGVHNEVREALKDFGQNFGFALQCFNDIGDYLKKDNRISQDLIFGRPSWIWICASEHLSAIEYLLFVDQVKSLRATDLSSQANTMLEIRNHKLINIAKREAQKLMSNCFQELNDRLLKFDYELNQRSDWKELQLLGQKITEAYV